MIVKYCLIIISWCAAFSLCGSAPNQITEWLESAEQWAHEKKSETEKLG